MKIPGFLPAFTLFASLILSGCTATEVMISKHNLEVQTKSSSSIFLDPVPDSQKTIYVQIKNTSDKPQFSIDTQVIALLNQKGYQVTHQLEKAHYLLQVNILQVGASSPSANEKALKKGYGSNLGAVAAGAAAGALIGGNDTGVLAGGLVGGIVSTVANSAVKDVTFSAITDVQISERSKTAIREKSQASLTQGTSSKVTQTSSGESHWRRYRTRILSTAEKANLKFETAEPALEKGLSTAVAGFF